MAALEASGERWWEPELHRVAGEIALMLIRPISLSRALLLAQKQQAKSWELRTAMSMARLWCDQGKRDEARDLLAPVYGWFTEGFGTRDLKDAKALFDELAS
jgi:predicted ATPase